MGVIETERRPAAADDDDCRKKPPPQGPSSSRSAVAPSASSAVVSVVEESTAGNEMDSLAASEAMAPAGNLGKEGDVAAPKSAPSEADNGDDEEEGEEEEELYVQVLRQRAKEEAFGARPGRGSSSEASPSLKGAAEADTPAESDEKSETVPAPRPPPRTTRTTTTVALVPPAHLRQTSSTGSAPGAASSSSFEKMRAAGYRGPGGPGPSSYPQGIHLPSRHDVTAGGIVGSVRSAPTPSPASLVPVVPMTSPGAFRVSSCTMGQMRDIQQDQGIEEPSHAHASPPSLSSPPSLAYTDSCAGTVATATSSVFVEAYVDEKSVASSEDGEGKGRSDLLVVEAKPFEEIYSKDPPECYKPPVPRRKMVCWLVPLVTILTIAVAVAIAMGVTTSSSRAAGAASSNATYYQDQLSQELPSATQAALADLTSPQYVALAWATSESERGRTYASEKEKQARTLQRFALATLFAASRGNSKWLEKKGWMNSSVDECDWYGASCDAEGDSQRIIGLNLTTNGLSMPSLPREIGILKNLQLLDLSNNQVSSTLPQEMDTLSNLQVLNLKATSLTGSLEPALISAWKKLIVLDLSLNKLSGPIPTQVGQLENLKVLHLGAVDSEYDGKEKQGLSGKIPSQIGTLLQLESLSLEVGSLSGLIPTDLGLLSNLKLLRLSDNLLTGPIPPELGLLESLETLEVDRNQLTGQLPESLAQLPLLRELAADGNLLTGQIPEALGANQSDLVSFGISNNQLNGTVPEGLCALVPDGLVVTVDCESVACDCGCQCAVVEPNPSQDPGVGNTSNVTVDGECWDNFTALFEDLHVQEPNASITYVICPNRRYSIGYESGPGNCCVNGDLPLVAKSNTRFQCGSDGSSSNNCVLEGGSSHVIVNWVIFLEDVLGAVIQGFTFESPDISTVTGVGNGDVTFVDCIFKDQVNVGPVVLANEGHNSSTYQQRKLERDSAGDTPRDRLNYVASRAYMAATLEGAKNGPRDEAAGRGGLRGGQQPRELQSSENLLVMSFEGCVFTNCSQGDYGDKFATYGLITALTEYSVIQVSNSIFVNNVYNGLTPYGVTGYAISSNRSDVSVSDTCFLDNDFAGFGVVELYGDALSDFTNNFVTGDEGTECPFAALMAAATRPDEISSLGDASVTSCTPADATSCGASIYASWLASTGS